jgi:hypothetical protein
MPPLPSACVRFVALVLAGLCLLGADFARPDPASFALGSTTEAEIRQRFGNPYGQTTSRVGDRVVTTLQYTYAEPRTGVIPARAMTYSFYDGRLVGFDYSSSFGADETAFDEKVVKRIKRGETTRTEVLAIAGPPTGQFIYPTPQATVPGRRAYVYGYSRSERLAPATLETANKVLTITFDDHDVVAELSLVMTTISRALPSGDRS